MNEPVSIIVLTYNSEKFVEETLESAKAQTYQNIELIVSDDGSTDNTIEICSKWLEKNALRFISTELMTVKKNTGISANCNRGLNASTNDLIKFIAGDDILLPNCISENVDYISNNPNSRIVFSQVKVFMNDFCETNIIGNIPKCFPENLMKKTFQPHDQFQILLLSDRINYTPSFFFYKEAVLSVNGYDESFPLMEDYQMWLKLTGAGYKLSYFHKTTVGYRINENAIINNKNNQLVKLSDIQGFKIRKKYAHQSIKKVFILRDYWIYHISKLFYSSSFNNQNKFSKICYKLTAYYLNPFVYFYKIQKTLKISTFKLINNNILHDYLNDP